MPFPLPTNLFRTNLPRPTFCHPTPVPTQRSAYWNNKFIASNYISYTFSEMVSGDQGSLRLIIWDHMSDAVSVGLSQIS